MEEGCEQPVVPTDPLWVGLDAGTSAAFDSTQARGGGGDPGSAGLDNPPSVTLQKVPGPSTETAHAEPQSETYQVQP